MGFGKRWMMWIQSCILNVSIQVLINGVPPGSFNTSRGLCQGCPISPMLFNMIGEALSVLIYKAMERGIVKGVCIGSSGYQISHLQFADDLILFLEASEDNIRNTKRVLRIFQAISGLQLNLNKTRMFGINVDTNTLKVWADSIKCSTDTSPTHYLGLPIGNTHNAAQIW
ncbi:hypothetical protein HRI_003571100 [Hibiscus trionum]|uniref:Reverse transcriptase domain-containing protein n=1 Tax=Hibiscus trionum TaxID=183268 RepID=A0A9W7MES6_HIBTR|nr:hypothetical protein HRI_003571100 [Hibiscus trionum]